MKKSKKSNIKNKNKKLENTDPKQRTIRDILEGLEKKKESSEKNTIPEKQSVRDMWEKLSKAATERKNEKSGSESEIVNKNKYNVMKKSTTTTTNGEQQQQQQTNNKVKIKTSTITPEKKIKQKG